MHTKTDKIFITVLISAFILFTSYILFNPWREYKSIPLVITHVGYSSIELNDSTTINHILFLNRDYHRVGDTVMYNYTREYSTDTWKLVDKINISGNQRAIQRQALLQDKLNAPN